MGRQIYKLTVIGIKNAKDGKLQDGGGLILVKKTVLESGFFGIPLQAADGKWDSADL